MRAMLWIGGIVLALTVLVGAGQLGAEIKANQKNAPRTRIALVNLTYVIKNYDKYRDFRDEAKEFMDPFQRKDASLRRQGEKFRAELEKLARDLKSGEQKGEKAIRRKDELETKVRLLQREIEDNTTEAKLVLGKRSDQMMVTLYRDLALAVKRYGVAHGFEMVLHYNDATTADEYYSAANIGRKLQDGALTPLTSKPGLDISTEILDELNLGPRQTP